MPDEDELDGIVNDILDQQDTIRRRSRVLPWNPKMEPTPETDEADERSEEQ